MADCFIVRQQNYYIELTLFTVFGVQMYFAWGDWNAIGRVFWNIIAITTVVGVTLSFIYAPRTWCSFCPMGTLSSWVAPKKAPYPKAFTSVYVDISCQMKCKSCARVCPMQITPYDSRGSETGYLHADCIKCGKCVASCPLKIMKIKPQNQITDDRSQPKTMSA
jgi:polyferredoxin